MMDCIGTGTRIQRPLHWHDRVKEEDRDTVSKFNREGNRQREPGASPCAIGIDINSETPEDDSVELSCRID